MRYRVTEQSSGGRTVFYVIDADRSRKIVASYLTRWVAVDKAASLNEQDKQPAY